MTTPTPTTTTTADIAEFAQQVRDELDDLPLHELDELTEGLVADLAASFADHEMRTMPDPAAYAAELRDAAGFPVRERRRSAGPGWRGALDALTLSWRETRADLSDRIRHDPATAATLDLLLELRPVWWILRGYAAYQLSMGLLGHDSFRDLWPMHPLDLITLVALVVGSVVVGKRAWPMPMRVMIAAGNVGAAFALFIILTGLDSGESQAYESGYTDGGHDAQHGGLALDGRAVTNVFAYGPDGDPLTGVQLFDQAGHPLDVQPYPAGPRVCPDPAHDCRAGGAAYTQAGVLLENGVTAWNVFPLDLIALRDGGGVPEPDPSAEPVTPKTPNREVPGVAIPDGPS